MIKKVAIGGLMVLGVLGSIAWLFKKPADAEDVIENTEVN